MNETGTAILASNLMDDKNLLQYLAKNRITVISKSVINTKESILPTLENIKPEFLFLSSVLPGVVGLVEIIGKVKQLSPRTKIILVVSSGTLESVVEYILVGTDAIIYFENLSDYLEHALKQLLKGQLFLCGISSNQIKTDLLKHKTEIQSDTALLDMLTDREVEVLYSLTQGINYKQIAKLLFISESTVKTHINNIFTKLNVNDRTRAVLYALHHGIDSLIRKPNLLQNITNVTINS